MVISFRKIRAGIEICFCGESQDDWLEIDRMRNAMLNLATDEIPEFEIDQKFRTLEISLKTTR